jgi:hypothetical protein
MFNRRITVGDGDCHPLPDLQLIHKSGGQREPDAQWAGGADPDQAFVSSHGLTHSNISTGDDPIERRCDLCLLQFQLQGPLAVTRIDEQLFDAFDVPLVRLGLELRVLKLFRSDELGIPHFAGATKVCLENLGLRLPIIEISFGTGGLSAGPVHIGQDLAVIQFGEELSFAHACAGFDENLGDYASSLGGHVNLILDNDRA